MLLNYCIATVIVGVLNVTARSVGDEGVMDTIYTDDDSAIVSSSQMQSGQCYYGYPRNDGERHPILSHDAIGFADYNFTNEELPEYGLVLDVSQVSDDQVAAKRYAMDRSNMTAQSCAAKCNMTARLYMLRSEFLSLIINEEDLTFEGFMCFNSCYYKNPGSVILLSFSMWKKDLLEPTNENIKMHIAMMDYIRAMFYDDHNDEDNSGVI